MIIVGNTPENRKQLIIDFVRSLFPHYEGSPDSAFIAIEDHIRVHGYFLQKTHNVHISEEECFTSWIEYILDPVLTGIWRRYRHTKYLGDPLVAYISISELWLSKSKGTTTYGHEFLQEALDQYFRGDR
jgi:hypothetical protein